MMIKKLFWLLSIFLISCDKDQLVEYTTVKPKYEIEGRYSGNLHIVCKQYNDYNKQYSNIWNITSFNHEKLAIETNEITTSAILQNDGISYEYIPYSTYRKDCVLIVFKYSGKGSIVNDTLRESGTVLIYYGSNELPMFGTFTGFGVKL